MKILPALFLLLALAFPSWAGNTASVYGLQGGYAGRIVQQPGQPGTATVYNAQGAYQGRIVAQPDGSGTASVYDAQGGYQGRVQQQPQAGEQTDQP